MLTRSISRTEAAPRPTETAVSMMMADSRSRSGPDKRLESSTPRMARWSGGMTTAHATTGPASGPRPTSSIPAMYGPSWPRRSRSMAFHRRATPLFGSRRLRNQNAHPLFLDPARLASEATEIEQLGATNATTANHRDLSEHRTMRREDPLYADTVGNLAHGERRAHSTPAATDAHTFEGLHALLIALTDAHAHLERIAGAEGRQVFQPLFL